MNIGRINSVLNSVDIKTVATKRQLLTEKEVINITKLTNGHFDKL